MRKVIIKNMVAILCAILLLTSGVTGCSNQTGDTNITGDSNSISSGDASNAGNDNNAPSGDASNAGNDNNAPSDDQETFKLREDMKDQTIQYFSIDGVKMNFPETVGDYIDSLSATAANIKMGDLLEAGNPEQTTELEAGESVFMGVIAYYINNNEYHLFSIGYENPTNKKIPVTDATVTRIGFYYIQTSDDEYYKALNTIVINDEIRLDNTYTKDELIAYLGEDNITDQSTDKYVAFRKDSNNWMFIYDENGIINSASMS